jgi:hypothetical protein
VSERFLIEIQTWDWNLFIGLLPATAATDSDPEGGLLYTRAVDITGVILAPEPARSKSIRISVTPFDTQTIFDGEGPPDVGRFYRSPENTSSADFAASLFLPESALDSTITCLSSIWRYAHIWADREDTDVSVIPYFRFSRDIGPGA